MLTQASDYRYCTPIAAGIRGSVLPMVDGTAAARVNRYEDVAFLVEAVRERYDWDIGRPRGVLPHPSDAVGDFESCGVVARRNTPLVDLVNAVGNDLHTVDESVPVGGAFSLAAADWDSGLSGSSFPIISLPDDPSSSVYPEHESAYYLFQNAAISRDTTPSVLPPRIVEGDTFRTMHDDIAKMKRFVFGETLTPLHNGSFDDTTFKARDEKWMVALQTDDRSDLYTPRLQWFASSGSYTNDFPGTLTFYIRKPFVVNALAQTRYYQSGTAYPAFHLSFTTKDSQDNWYFTETSAIFRIVNVSVDPVSSANFEGSFTIDMTSSRMQGYIGLIMQKLQQSPLVLGSVQSIGITFNAIFFDPGNIALQSTVPSS